MFGVHRPYSGEEKIAQRLLQDLRALLSATLFPPKCLLCATLFRPPRRIPPSAGEAGRHDTSSGMGSAQVNQTPVEKIEEVFEREMAPMICTDCLGPLTPPVSPLCPRCGLVFISRAGVDHWCGDCIRRSPGFNKACAAGVYEHTLMAAIQRYKYHGKTQLAKPLGKILALTMKQHWKKRDIDAMVPVPLHHKRLRQRGFDQAALMLRTTPWSVPVEYGILKRVRATVPQTALHRRERQKNVRRAFQVVQPARVSGRRLLLVDDVFTTGATVNECSRVLLQHGADRVDVLTLARAM